MAKKLTQIKVETKPNGYSLTVYQTSYLYFNEMELFEGMLYHAGIAIFKEQDKKVIHEVVANLFAGVKIDLIKRNQEQQAEIESLTAKISKLQSEKTKLEAKLKKCDKKRVMI